MLTKIIEEWSYPMDMTEMEINADTDRKKAVGYRKSINATLVPEASWGEQTNNNYLKSETIMEDKK